MAEVQALIADDEPTGRRTVRLLLEQDPTIEVVGECASGEETVEAVLRHEPDLLFLDIRMQGGDGFAVLAQIPPEVMPLVIFVTAFDHYALKAFDVAAADYLLKPFTDERFHAAVARAKERLAQRSADDARRLVELVRRLVGSEGADLGTPPLARPTFLDRIAIRTSGAVRLLPVGEIEWIEARGDYVRVHSGGRADLVREPIGHLEARLDPRRFVRVHRSAIVNLARVREVLTPPFSPAVAVLQSGQRCRLSRGGRERLEKVLGQSI